ncbi:efflux RND transporter periplasmic adaptor subunit [Methyloversatilis universalis]|uniref:efflux RND transporter periplasmic adaptor subunit n=1 Tax=Methyloversatilis universalis TaxID=378211 RepID=UPI00039AAA72|nr:efflux RND transporter periplasmic adaptor subunit [Methyloversatilis universalis]
MTETSSVAARRRRTVLIVSAAVLAAAAAYGLLRSRPPVEAAAPAPAAAPGSGVALPQGASQLSFIVTARTDEVELPLTAPLNARVAVAEDRTARVFSPLVGRVLRLAAAPGDTVPAGATLADIDAPDLGQASADARRAEADADLRHKALARARTLLDAEVLPRREFEVAQAEAAAADAEVQRARQRLQSLAPRGVSGQTLALRTPLAGVVTERHATPGLEVRPDAEQPLFVVSDLSRLWLLIDLPEQELGKFRVGDRIEVSIDAWPDERFSATVSRIAPVLDPQTRRVQVRCDLPNADGRLRPEMFARAHVLSDSGQRVLRLPTSALVSDGLYTAVFVQTAPGQFSKRRVKALRQDAREAYVQPAEPDGLRGGDTVVVRGALLLDAELGEAK